MGRPRIFVDFNDWGHLSEAPGRLRRFTRIGQDAISELRDQGVEPAAGVHVTLYGHDASDKGEPLYLVNEGVLQWDEERERWVAAFDPSAFEWEPRST